MKFELPILFSVVASILQRWYFWALVLVLSLFGVLLQRQDDSGAACRGYSVFVKPNVEAAIDSVLGRAAFPQPTTASGPATLPTSQPTDVNLGAILKSTIHDYFCARATTRPGPWTDWPSWAELKIAIPGALVISGVIVSLLPLPSHRTQIADRMNAALAAAPEAGQMVAQRRPTSMDAAYVETALSARQLRIAVLYAALSGTATVLMPPAFAPTGWGSIADNGGGWHGLALLAAVIVAILYGMTAFARANLPTRVLAWRLGWGPVFFAGLIALLLSLPYQALRPEELRPLSRNAVLLIIAFRLFLLPAVAALVVVLARPVVRWLFR